MVKLECTYKQTTLPRWLICSISNILKVEYLVREAEEGHRSPWKYQKLYSDGQALWIGSSFEPEGVVAIMINKYSLDPILLDSIRIGYYTDKNTNILLNDI